MAEEIKTNDAAVERLKKWIILKENQNIVSAPAG